MPNNIDQFNFLFDCTGISLANLEIKHAQAMFKCLSYWVEIVHKVFLIESGYVMWGFYKLIKILLPQRVQDKVEFVSIPQLHEHITAD